MNIELIEFKLENCNTIDSWESRMKLDIFFNKAIKKDAKILLLGYRLNSYYLDKDDLHRLNLEFNNRLEDLQYDCKLYDYLDNTRKSATYLLEYSLTEVILFFKYFELCILICSPNIELLNSYRNTKNLFSFNSLNKLIYNDEFIFSLYKKDHIHRSFYSYSPEIINLIEYYFPRST